MSEESKKDAKYLDASQIIFLPRWARYGIMSILGLLALSACAVAVVFVFIPELREKVTPVLSIAQTAAGGFAVVLFVLFAERQIGTDKLHLKTDAFLEKQLVESLAKIEAPQVMRGHTLQVKVVKREETIHGGRKDIYGANYHLSLADFQMRMWIGINVKRIGIIYFAKAESSADAERFKEVFRFTFGGAAKMGYDTNFEYVEVDGEKLVSIWSTVMADNVILGNPAEQLFWVQDIAMMTQSVIRTALRNGIVLHTATEPGPL